MYATGSGTGRREFNYPELIEHAREEAVRRGALLIDEEAAELAEADARGEATDLRPLPGDVTPERPLATSPITTPATELQEQEGDCTEMDALRAAFPGNIIPRELDRGFDSDSD